MTREHAPERADVERLAAGGCIKTPSPVQYRFPAMML